MLSYFFFNNLDLKRARFRFQERLPIFKPTTHLFTIRESHFRPEYMKISYPIKMLGIVLELL